MSFSVCSYNVLADAYIDPRWYPTTPAEALSPRQRLPALLRHIASFNADVLCLQEVDPALFDSLQSRLGLLGYQGEYARKGGGKPDGCATFIRTATFDVRLVHPLRYQDGGAGRPDSGHLALILILECDDRTLGVANTHLKWDAPATPLEQQWGSRQIGQLLSECKHISPYRHGWIIGGDLNMTVDSDVVRALLEAGLLDAYQNLDHAFTCNSNRKAKRIDYLFHTPDLSAAPKDLPAIDADTPLPSADHPSDHLAIAARFDWKAP